MRIAGRLTLAAILASSVHFAAVRHVRAQDAQVLMPDESAAKAKQVLQQAIDSLGGAAYLNVQDATCTGDISQFDHSGAMTGYGKFILFSMPPDKQRQENLPKRNIIYVFNGDNGWTLDRGGVGDALATDLAAFQGDLEIDINNILRRRIHEPGMIFRYDGQDVVNLKEVDWVELVDGGDRTFRIAISRSTHLPVEKTTETQDPDTRMRTVQIEDYSNYQLIQGIQTPFQITRWRNQMHVYQAFFTDCQYNTNLSVSLFTRQSLEDRWDQLGGKHKNKKDKS